MTRPLRLLVIGVVAIAMVCPPWAQDDPAAPMAVYAGTKFSNGHSFVLRRPAPAAPSDRWYAPPPSIPVEIDVAQWAREVLTVAIVMVAVAGVVSRSALNPGKSERRQFGRRGFVVALLLGLIAPIPLIGPVSFQPWWMLTDSNHGIPGWVMMTVIWLVVSFGTYLTLGLVALIIQPSVRLRAAHARAPA